MNILGFTILKNLIELSIVSQNNDIHFLSKPWVWSQLTNLYSIHIPVKLFAARDVVQITEDKRLLRVKSKRYDILMKLGWDGWRPDFLVRTSPFKNGQLMNLDGSMLKTKMKHCCIQEVFTKKIAIKEAIAWHWKWCRKFRIFILSGAHG